MSYKGVLNESFKNDKELYNNLRLLEDKFKESENLQKSIKDAQAKLEGQTFEDSSSLKELAADTIRQTLNINESFHDKYQNNKR